MEGKTLQALNKLVKRLDGMEIDRCEVKDNYLYFIYKNGTRKKIGKVSVSCVAWNNEGGEVPGQDIATKSWVLNKGYTTQGWVESQGYLTEHQSLTDYAMKSWVIEQGYLTESALSGYATQSWVNEQGFLTEHQSLDGYATQTWVEAKNYLTEHQSLEGYATENWVESKNYLTEHQSLEGYATETWVEGKGYLTEHQDISSLATKSELSNALTNYYTKPEVNNLITFVVHLQDVEGGLQADYTFAQILSAINRMQWVILKYQEQTYTVYERDNSHILWQSTRYYSSTLATKLFNLTSADVWSKESQTLSLNDIKPIVVHITKEGSTVTADYTFNQLIGAVSDQVIECCYNGNHVPMGTHTSQKITFTAQDVDMDTGATTEIVIEVDNTNTWRMIEDTYVPLKQDKLLYDYAGGLHVDGTLNSTYVDENGMLITTGSSGEWDAWNITDMDLSEFKIIRFVCYRDSSNTGGTWVCDVPLLTPIQISGGVGFFVSSGAMNSFGDRNRWNVLQAGVRWNNGDIDAVSIGQVFSLYGTAATTVNGIKCCAVYGVY